MGSVVDVPIHLSSTLRHFVCCMGLPFLTLKHVSTCLFDIGPCCSELLGSMGVFVGVLTKAGAETGVCAAFFIADIAKSPIVHTLLQSG